MPQAEALNWRTFKFFAVSATALSGFSTCKTIWQPSLVSGQIYIGEMRVNPENQVSSDPLFIEVPKPVNLMTPAEKDEFIDEILAALEGK